MPISIGKYKENIKAKTDTKDELSENDAQETDKKVIDVNSPFELKESKHTNKENDVISNNIDNLCNKNINSKDEQVGCRHR